MGMVTQHSRTEARFLGKRECLSALFAILLSIAWIPNLAAQDKPYCFQVKGKRTGAIYKEECYETTERCLKFLKARHTIPGGIEVLTYSCDSKGYQGTSQKDGSLHDSDELENINYTKHQNGETESVPRDIGRRHNGSDTTRLHGSKDPWWQNPLFVFTALFLFFAFNIIRILRTVRRKRKRFAQEAARAAKEPSSPGPPVDPLAVKTDWTPVNWGGISIRTHRLVEVSPMRLEFRATPAAKFIGLFLLILGTALVAAYFYPDLIAKILPWVPFEEGDLVVGVIPAIIGGVLLSMCAPRVFDKSRGIYWKGWKPSSGTGTWRGGGASVSLERIQAFQLLTERIRSSSSSTPGKSYKSHELNLVLEDGKRINVVDHGNLAKLRYDTERLSRFLGKPVWDHHELMKGRGASP